MSHCIEVVISLADIAKQSMIFLPLRVGGLAKHNLKDGMFFLEGEGRS